MAAKYHRTVEWALDCAISAANRISVSSDAGSGVSLSLAQNSRNIFWADLYDLAKGSTIPLCMSSVALLSRSKMSSPVCWLLPGPTVEWAVGLGALMPWGGRGVSHYAIMHLQECSLPWGCEMLLRRCAQKV